MATMNFTSACEYNTWIKTDDSQWVYRNNYNQFWIIQTRLLVDDYCVTLNLIDLDTYDDEDIFKIMKTYGYTEEEIMKIDSRYIAENLVEDIDDFRTEFEGTYKECKDWIEEYIKTHDGSFYKF